MSLEDRRVDVTPPQNPHNNAPRGWPPQESHGQYGTSRYTAAPLLEWFFLALTSHYAGRKG
jgi:hypothetical protein